MRKSELVIEKTRREAGPYVWSEVRIRREAERDWIRVALIMVAIFVVGLGLGRLLA